MRKLFLSTSLFLFTLLDYGQSLKLPQESQVYMIENDNFTYQDKVFGNYSLGWVNDQTNPGAPTLWSSGFGGIKFFTKGLPRLSVSGNGNVGIGTDSPQAKLDVDGDVLLRKNIQLQQENQMTMLSTDNMVYRGRTFGNYAFGWVYDDQLNSGAPTLWMSGFGGMKLFTSAESRLVINKLGNVGIGTENPQNKLDVAGTIHAQEVKIDLDGWADYVFDKDYKLPNLDEVKAHIDEHKHLPGIPSEKQVLEEGVNMGAMQAKLLQKIEELTLYAIKQQETIDKLTQNTIELQGEVEKLKETK